MSYVAQADTIAAIFSEQVGRAADDTSILFVRDGKTVSWTWAEVDEAVSRYTAALSEWGVGRGDHVVHWSANRAEWIVTDIALSQIGAIHIPIHSTLSAAQTIAQIVHSESKFGIVSGDELLQQLIRLKADLPATFQICTYDKVRPATKSALARHGVGNLSTLAAAANVTDGRAIATRTADEVDPADVSTILYSSGTTGEPKGVMLSQKNLIFNARGLAETFSDQEKERKLNFLPFSHIFGRTCDVYTWLIRGAELALTQSRDTIIDDCKRFNPDSITGVPFFFERVRQKIEEKGVADQPGILQKTFGGNVRACFSGGGALASQTLDYYQSQGVELLQGYGLTESSPVITFSTMDVKKDGSAGVALNNVDVRIADDGEILTRGDHVMQGYWRDGDLTNETIRDGWLHTGDLGRMDDEGHLFITGRKKEMLVTATGKNVFPSHIEELLCRDPLILQAVVVGDKRNCLAALIVPDPDVLKSEIKKRRLWVFSRKHAVRHRKVVEMYRERINKQLAELAHHEQVPLFKVLHHGFTIEAGFMTAKLSLRRSVIEEAFADLIESLYSQRRK